LTRTPLGAYSAAHERAKEASAAFGGSVGGAVRLTDGCRPLLAMLMITPLPRATIFGRQYRHQQVGGLHVGGEQLIQGVGVQLFRRAEPGDTGVVDKDVDLAGLVGQLQAHQRVREVGPDKRAEPPAFSISVTTSAPRPVSRPCTTTVALRG